MAAEDNEIPEKSAPGEIRVGDDLSRLSVEELSERLVALEKETKRILLERESRASVKAAADALFRK